jgi:mono/diheme cytochrome c family protein
MALLLGVALALPAPRTGAEGNKPGAGPAVVHANDDLTKEEREDFYHLPEGSELIPADWLGALVSVKTGKRFVEGLGRFGLLDDPDGPVLDYGPGRIKMPVGLTLVEPLRLPAGVLGKVVGVNCASCHTGEMTYTPPGQGAKPVTVRVDGAPARFDVEGFYQEMFQSVEATVATKERFAAFLKRLDENKNKSKLSRLLIKLGPYLAGAADGDELAKALVGRVQGLLAAGPLPPGGAAPLYHAILTAPAEKRAGLVKDLLQKQAEQKVPAAADLLARLAHKPTDAKEDLRAALRGVAVEELALLEARLVFLKRLRGLHAPGVPQYPPGPGRVDAFVTARNLLFDQQFNIPASSPVRFPALWVLGPKPDAKAWLHWDGNTNSVMERNIGQALGLGAVADPKNAWSTVRPKELHQLEGHARKLKAPRWPASFGRIDRKSQEYRDGEKLYAGLCARCHDAKPGKPPAGGKIAPDGGVVFPASAIGTDPERANNFAARLGKDELAAKLGEVLRAIKEQAYKDAKIPPAERAKMDLPQKDIRWQTTRGYVARPLAGAWARAPYLHNGSVPTLDDLLKPAAQRPWVFPVGHSEYDPEKVGHVSEFARVPPSQRKSVFLFDTRVKGNSNAGHEGKDYGTELKEKERKALLTYLKALGG